MRPEEIESMYRKHGHIVVRRAAAILGNRADAEELAQDLFESFLERPPVLDGRASIVTYLYQATTNRALNRLRDARNRLRLIAERGVDPEDRPGGAEERVLAAEVLASLPDEEARAVVYSFVDGMSHAEIAEMLGCSRRHAGNLLERASERVAPLEAAS